MILKKVINNYLFLSLFFLSSCALNVSMGDSKNEGFYGKVDSLSIIILARNLGGDEIKVKDFEFKKINNAFKSRGIISETFINHDIDFTFFSEKNNSFSTKRYSLILNPSSTIVTGDTVNVRYILALLDNEKKKKIWGATLLVPMGWTTSAFQRFDEMGQRIAERLHADGII